MLARARAWLLERPDAAAIALAVALVVYRSAAHVALPNAHFDSDQALLGLMGVDLAHGRELPFYCYGQQYLFAMISWLAAPLFALFGTSIPALKLPLVALNAVATWLLYRGLRASRLSPRLALFASLPLAVPSVYIAMCLVAAHGSTIEPFVGVLLLWALRDRWLAFGFVGGVFYLNREFTLYAVPALVVADLVSGLPRDRGYLARRGAAFATMGAVIALGRILGRHGAYYFGVPAVPIAVERHPLDAITWLLRDILPPLLGAANGPAGATGPLATGAWMFRPLAVLLVAVLVVVALRLFVLRARLAAARADLAFPAYLVGIAVVTCGALTVLAGMPKDVWSLRYAYFAVLALPGLLGAYFVVETSERARRAVLGLGGAFFAIHLALHAAFAATSAASPPKDDRVLATWLVAHGYEVGSAPYWVSYDVSFRTDERVVLTASDGRIAMPRYEERFRAGQGKGAVVQSEPCASGGEHVAAWWVCPR